MKTVSDLNSKWWYRFIKVAFILIMTLLILGIPTAIFFSYTPSYDNDKSYIKCANGKQFILSENDIHLYSDYMGSYDIPKAENLCFDGERDLVPAGRLTYKYININVTEKSGKYELISFYEDRNWNATIGYSFLAIVGIGLVFEAILRAFYYIVLGTIRPKK